jgi:hypothetical protein
MHFSTQYSHIMTVSTDGAGKVRLLEFSPRE